MPSGKVASLQINGIPFGEYDECLSIESPEPKDKEQPIIYGHYCSMGIPSNLFPPANLDHIEDNKRLDEMYAKQLRDRLNSSASANSVEMNFIRDHIQTESDGMLLYTLIKYLDYLDPDKVRLPTGLCLPSTCNPKDVEYALNKSKS